MKRLFHDLMPYFIKYRWYLIGGTFFIILSNWLSIWPAQVVRYAFDLVEEMIKINSITKGFKAQDGLHSFITKTLIIYAILVVILSILRGVFLFLVRQTLIVLSRKIEFEQKNELYLHYQNWSRRLFKKHRTGDLMSRISEDIGNVRMFTGPGIMYSINTFTLFVMIFITMLFVNVELTLYVMIPLPLMAVAIYFVHSMIIKRSEEAQAQLGILTSFVQESFSGIRLLKAYGRETVFNKKYESESLAYRGKAMRQVQVDAFFFPMIMLLIGLSNIFIVWIGGEKVISGQLTIGNIAEFIIYVNLLVWPIAALGWVTSLLQKAAAGQNRINEVLSQQSEIKFPAESSGIRDGSIEFDHVSLTYPETGIQALNKISFKVTPKSVFGIVGMTGSGKSTIANAMCRLIEADSGRISIDGKPIESWSEQALRQAIAYVTQDVFLFSDTISNNIAFGCASASEEEIHNAAQFAGLYDDIMDFPEGFKTIIGERGVTLSGGQKQRLSIARAYMIKAPILILDDSLSAIDTRTEERILNNLRDFKTSNYQPTLIIITHRLTSVQQADEVIVLEDGKLIEQGKHSELVNMNGLYAKMYFRQQLEEEIKTL